MRVFLVLLIGLTANLAKANECEKHLGAIRFQDDIRTFKNSPGADPWFVNPAHYEAVHGGRPIYLQSKSRIEESLAPFFDYIDEEFKEMLAIYLLKVGAIQARVDSKEGELQVTALWLNGRPWSWIVRRLDGIEPPVRILARLDEWANDKSLMPTPASRPAQELLEIASLSDDSIDLFAISTRAAAPLQAYTRRYIMEELQSFMDYRTAHELVEGMISKRMISVEILQDHDRFRVGKIRILDRYGFRTPLPSIVNDLRKWYAELNRERNLRASLRPYSREISSQRLISRIYRGD